jgi:glycosyltransferase involved in cell wall biosynthesis
MQHRICFYVFGYPPDYSGATIQAIKLSSALAKRGHQSMFVTHTSNPSVMSMRDASDSLKRFFSTSDGTLAYHARMLQSLYSQRDRFDVIYINGNNGQFSTASFIALFGALFRKKVFMELNMEHDDPLYIRGRRLSSAKERVATLIDGFISLSTAIHEKMREQHPKLKSHLIYNGVDLNVFRPAQTQDEKMALRRKLNIPLDHKLVVACGAIRRRKGIDFLLKVWERVVQRSPQKATLCLLGPMVETEKDEASFGEKMVQLAANEVYQGSVRFCGSASNVEEYFRTADALVFAGRREGSPNVLREAMASGLPIVSLELRGVTSDMIEHCTNGLIVPVPDQRALGDFAHCDIDNEAIIEEFTQNVLAVLSDPAYALRLGSRARETAEREFSLDDQALKLVRLIEDASSRT